MFWPSCAYQGASAAGDNGLGRILAARPCSPDVAVFTPCPMRSRVPIVFLSASPAEPRMESKLALPALPVTAGGGAKTFWGKSDSAADVLVGPVSRSQLGEPSKYCDSP